MNEEKALQEFGLEPGSQDRERIRTLLQQEIDNSVRGTMIILESYVSCCLQSVM